MTCHFGICHVICHVTLQLTKLYDEGTVEFNTLVTWVYEKVVMRLVQHFYVGRLVIVYMYI